MALTTAQLSTLKAAILANPTWSAQPNTNVGNSVIAAALNAVASPEFVVWRRSVPTDSIGPALNYVAVANLTTINRDRATTFVALNQASFNATQDIADYWDTTFAGTLGGQGATVRATLQALWRRSALLIEKILAAGTGTTLSPAMLGYEGTITPDEIEQARSS